MSRLTAVFCILLCLTEYSCPAQARVDLPRPWIWTLSENMDWLCGLEIQEGVPVEVYVWVSPDSAGILCLEYQVLLNAYIESPPYNIELTGTEANPLVSTSTGTPAETPGVSVCLQTCMYDIFWAHKLIFMPLSNNPLVYIDVAGLDGSEQIEAVSCATEGDPVIHLNHWVWDWTGGIGGTCPGVEEKSWGAIKSLFNEGGR